MMNLANELFRLNGPKRHVEDARVSPQKSSAHFRAGVVNKASVNQYIPVGKAERQNRWPDSVLWNRHHHADLAFIIVFAIFANIHHFAGAGHTQGSSFTHIGDDITSPRRLHGRIG
jgi:hypothetical protein